MMDEWLLKWNILSPQAGTIPTCQSLHMSSGVDTCFGLMASSMTQRRILISVYERVVTDEKAGKGVDFTGDRLS